MHILTSNTYYFCRIKLYNLAISETSNILLSCTKDTTLGKIDQLLRTKIKPVKDGKWVELLILTTKIKIQTKLAMCLQTQV